MIESSVTEACKACNVNPRDEDYRSAATCAFFALYRRHFSVSGPWFWEDAYMAMYGAIKILKSQNEFYLYNALSLDAPIERDTETTRLSLIPSRHGDPLPGIMLWDYLRRLPEDEHVLAYRLAVHRDSLEEARSQLGWDPGRLREAVLSLRDSMTYYLAS